MCAVRTLKITLAYDGTDLVGWQRQSEGLSVQLALEDALARLQGRPVTAVGAGRTDAGVHASGQVASVTIDVSHDVLTIRRALNAMLPESVRVLGVEDAPRSFHARFGAVSKTYHYRLLNGPVASPFLRRYAWHVPWALDEPAMAAAAARLVGEHDFAAFQSTGGDVRTTVRRILRSELRACAVPGEHPAAPGPLPAADADTRLLVYEVEGSGFLRHMVRAIVGTLVEVGSGRAAPDLVSALLARPDRALAGPTAPSAGLCLAGVRYGDARLRLDDKSL
jgi:tRNA pseudouridine38-40 synthase